MLLLLLACPTATLPSAPTGEAWTLALSSHFEESGRSLDWHLRGRIEAMPARGFRDGSTSVLVRFVDLEEAPSAQGPWVRAGLDGRSVEMRRFENGEILDLAQVEHLAGPPRHGDVLDWIFAAISPSPPRVASGESAYRRSSWPFLLRKDVGWRQALQATWTNQGFQGAGSARTALLDYEGTLEGSGFDERLDRRYQVSGSAQGRVLLQASNGNTLHHELHWSRTVDFVDDQQLQVFDLVLEAAVPGAWSAPVPREAGDDIPLGNYLDPQDVHDALIPQLAVFQPCYEHSGAAGRTEVGEVFLDFTIAPNGSVRDGTIRDSRSGFPALDACLAEKSAELSFPGHDEEPLMVGYPLVWRQSALQPYPMVFVKDRAVGELFVMPL